MMLNKIGIGVEQTIKNLSSHELIFVF